MDEDESPTMMPGIEELKDMVAHTLESKGVLGQIRAHLRAAVFTALDEQDRESGKIHLQHERAQKMQASEDAILALALVKEFLDYHECDHTLNVLAAEANLDDVIPGRAQLRLDVGLPATGSGMVADRPVLIELLSSLRTGTRTVHETSTSPKDKKSPVISPRETPERQPEPIKDTPASPDDDEYVDEEVISEELYSDEEESEPEKIAVPVAARPTVVPPLASLPPPSGPLAPLAPRGANPLPPLQSAKPALPALPVEKVPALPVEKAPPVEQEDSVSDVDFGSDDGIEDLLDTPAETKPKLAPLAPVKITTNPKAERNDRPGEPLQIGDKDYLVVEDIEPY